MRSRRLARSIAVRLSMSRSWRVIWNMRALIGTHLLPRNVMVRMMSVAPCFMFGSARRVDTALGTTLLRRSITLRVTVSRRCVPVPGQATESTSRSTLLLVVRSRERILGHRLKSVGARSPMCLLAYRVESMAVIRSLQVLSRRSVAAGRGRVDEQQVTMRRSCRRGSTIIGASGAVGCRWLLWGRRR